MKQTKGRVEDALHATRAAVAEGIVPGGGVALLRCMPIVEALAEKLKGDEQLGAEIVARALEKPIRTIAENCGVDGAVVADEVATRGEKNPNIGYNANTGEYVDMFKAGIIDPTARDPHRPAERRQHRRPDAHDRGDGHQDRRGRQEVAGRGVDRLTDQSDRDQQSEGQRKADRRALWPLTLLS